MMFRLLSVKEDEWYVQQNVLGGVWRTLNNSPVFRSATQARNYLQLWVGNHVYLNTYREIIELEI